MGRAASAVWNGAIPARQTGHMFNRPAFTRVELQNGDGIREAGARSRQLVPRRDSAVAGDFDLSQGRSTVADGDTRFSSEIANEAFSTARRDHQGKVARQRKAGVNRGR